MIDPPKRRIYGLQLSIVTWDTLYEYSPRLSPKEQLIKDLLGSQRYFDPTIKQLVSLMEGPEEAYRRFTKEYCDRIETLHKSKLISVRKSYHYREISKHNKMLEVVMRQRDRVKGVSES